jgi:hypothetical protein
MRKIAAVGLIVVAASLLLVSRSEASGRHFHGSHPRHAYHSRVVIGFGPAVYFGPYPYPYYYYPPPPAVVYTLPPVVVQEAPVYVQQAPPAQAAPLPPAPAPSAELYWYYCQSAGGYYPTVASCPEAWVKVPPRP